MSANNNKTAKAKDCQQREIDMDFTVTRIKAAPKVKVFKVIAGGKTTVAETLLSHYNGEATRRKDDDEIQVSDWRAAYTQFLASHALGTVPYRWERGGHEQAVLLEIAFRDPIDVYVFDGPALHDGSIPAVDKALAIKRRLKIDPDVPLMKGLGRQNKMALVRETAKEWELIMDLDHLKRLACQERKVARFQRHKTFPITTKWCWEGKPPWLPWDEDNPPPIADLDVTWIDKATKEDVE